MGRVKGGVLGPAGKASSLVDMSCFSIFNFPPTADTEASFGHFLLSLARGD